MKASDTLATLAVLSILVLASACGKKEDPAWSGYIEGDYVYVASPLAGALQTLAVRRGESVAKGAALFALESESERAAQDEAAARLALAQAQAADTSKGKRVDEIAVVSAQLAQARAQSRLADAELARQQRLRAQGFVSAAAVDDARAASEQARAHVSELTAAQRVANLPARTDERAAAEAGAQAAQEALRQTEWRTGQKQQKAPADARVADTFFRVGEWVQAGQPVVSLLPPGNVKARFFVPEGEIASIVMGQNVSLTCDGCGGAVPARIDFVATQAEYTPPVIYSNSQRSRLVFMVEARPDPKDGQRLRPGQPIDVRRAASAASDARS